MRISRRFREAILDVVEWSMTIAVFALAGFMVWGVIGCTTVHQDAVPAASAGSYTAPVRVAEGYVVDQAFRDRYNALVAVSGHKQLANGAPLFLPPLKQDQGLTPAGGQWLMTREAMENMVVLSDLKRRGAAP